MIKIKTRHNMQAILIAILSALLFVSGCGDAATVNAPTDAEESAEASEQKDAEEPEASEAPEETMPAGEGDAAVPSNERIGFITQEYDGDNIVEIPYIEYDGDMNPEIESINRLLNQGLQFSYEDFLENKDEDESIQIKSYPFTSDDYLQIVITKYIYPTVATEGELQSINYDKNAKKWLTNEDALELMGLSEEDVSAGVGENFDPELVGGYIDEVEIAGFLIHDISGDGQIELLLNVTVESFEDGDKWQGFFAYLPDANPNTNDLVKLNDFCLFDPYNMDQMDPPLFYQKIPDYSIEPTAMPEWEGVYENEWHRLEITDFSGTGFQFTFYADEDIELVKGVATLTSGDDFTAEYMAGTFILSEDCNELNVSEAYGENGDIAAVAGDYYKSGY